LLVTIELSTDNYYVITSSEFYLCQNNQLSSAAEADIIIVIWPD